jgi:chromosome segregation ATPase
MKEIIKKEIYEIKKTTQDIEEELNKDMKNLKKKNQTEILEIKSPFSQTRNTVEGHFSRLEQVEDKISELKYKIDVKEKNRRTLSQTTQEI